MIDWEEKRIVSHVLTELFVSELILETVAWLVVSLHNADDFFSRDMTAWCINKLTLLQQVEQFTHFESDVLPDGVGGLAALREILEHGAQGHVEVIEDSLGDLVGFLWNGRKDRLDISTSKKNYELTSSSGVLALFLPTSGLRCTLKSLSSF